MVVYGMLVVLFVTLLASPGVNAAPQDSLAVPDAPAPISGTFSPTEEKDVRLVSHQGEWTSFFSMVGSEPIFLISGQVENVSEKPLSYVKFQFELLGKDDVVVLRDHGYNRKAEELREEDYESGKKSLQDARIEQINAGEQENFRFIFFKKDIPEFRTYRIRVLETH